MDSKMAHQAGSNKLPRVLQGPTPSSLICGGVLLSNVASPQCLLHMCLAILDCRADKVESSLSKGGSARAFGLS